MIYENGKFRRLSESIASSISEGVYTIHTDTAGGRLRFVTNSRFIAINAKMGRIGRMSHFALTGSAGFDLYEAVNNTHRFLGTFIPPIDMTDGYDSMIDLGSQDERSLTLHFPLYSGIDELLIGLDPDAYCYPAEDYIYPSPVVYYGSSITQGGCVPRPGNAYPNMISLKLDCDHINLGFFGNAKGEPKIAEYLQNTHERMYQTVRAKHQQLPLIMLSMPKASLLKSAELCKRQTIIEETYRRAKASGDDNVYFISGTELLGDSVEMATVDNCHPNDIGFYHMAKNIVALLQTIL